MFEVSFSRQVMTIAIFTKRRDRFCCRMDFTAHFVGEEDSCNLQATGDGLA